MPAILNGVQVTEDQILSLYNAQYTQGLVYPTLTAGVTVVSAAANWTLGTVTQIIPAATVVAPYHVSLVSIESCDKDGVFELTLYYGATDIKMSTIRFAVEGGYFGNQLYEVPSVKIPANNDKLSAALACSTGGAGAATITISVVYRVVV